MDFQKSYYASVRSNRLVNLELTADFLIPNIYDYPFKDSEADGIYMEFLHLLGGGNIHTDFPISFSFRPLNYGLILYTERAAAGSPIPAALCPSQRIPWHLLTVAIRFHSTPSSCPGTSSSFLSTAVTLSCTALSCRALESYSACLSILLSGTASTPCCPFLHLQMSPASSSCTGTFPRS